MSVLAVAATGAELDHSRWDAVLQQHVTTASRVDYLVESFWPLNFFWSWAGSGDLSGRIQDWFLNLGREYGVNPIVFGSIYVGAIPLFSLSVAWLIRNLRRRQSPLIPALCASFCFVSAYLYLLIAGQNIPAWVYFFVAGMLAFGVHSTVRKIKSKLREGDRT